MGIVPTTRQRLVPREPPQPFLYRVIDPEAQRVVDVDPPLESRDQYRPLKQDGFPLAGPFATTASWVSIWLVDGRRLKSLGLPIKAAP